MTVWEIPPNTQGIAALIGLNILSGFDLSNYPRESVESYHLQIEAIKLAFADLHKYVADERFFAIPTEHFLDHNYAARRRNLITDTAISLASPGLPTGGTVYLATADNDLMVSFIQSNYHGFGSGILPHNTGIALQNRGYGFTLESGHANQYAARGHDVQYSSNIGLFGRGQIIRKQNGFFIAASDYRADGLASVW